MSSEPVLEQHTKTTSTTVREITKDGVTMDINWTGELSGKLKGMSMGTTTVWMKSDGTSSWEDKMIGNTMEGDMFVGMGKGTGKMGQGGRQDWSGETQMMSQSPKLAWLNEKFKSSGTADPAKGGSSGKFWSMK